MGRGMDQSSFGDGDEGSTGFFCGVGEKRLDEGASSERGMNQSRYCCCRRIGLWLVERGFVLRWRDFGIFRCIFCIFRCGVAIVGGDGLVVDSVRRFRLRRRR